MIRGGSLCSGYSGLDLGVALALGQEVDHVYFVEFDADPSRILYHHFADVPNLGDVKALEWANELVDVVTAGYPCQPFSAAGKRLGTEDHRHLWPSIAAGIERSRPRVLCLENVRGHLSLGFDVVLADCDRLGYDVRFVLVKASDVGAPHGRARLFILGYDRAAGGFPVPTGQPIARVVTMPPEPFSVMSKPTWVEIDEGLFGPVPWPPAFPKSGALVGGVLYEVPSLPSLPSLPTPVVNDMGEGKTVEWWDAWTRAQQLKHGNGNGHGPSLAVEAQRLLPTPEAKLSDSGPDYARSNRDGSGGDDLTTTVFKQLLPTPTARDHKGANQRGDATCLPGALLPTPTAMDAAGSRNATAYRGPEAGPHNSGTTLTDFAWQYEGHVDPKLLPTPRASDGEKGGPNQAGSKGDLMLPSAVQPHHLLPMPGAQMSSGNANVEWVGDALYRPDGSKISTHLTTTLQHMTPDRWGIYAEAIARWEALTRPAPDPTEPGSKGQPRLAPRFVEWMMGLPDGWVTAVPGLSRNAQLKALGNGVVPQQAAEAYRRLGLRELLMPGASR